MEEGMGDSPVMLESSSDDSPRSASPRHRYRDDKPQWILNGQYQRDYRGQREIWIKINTLEFDGHLDPDEFCDWLLTIERVMDARISRLIESFSWFQSS